MTSSTVREGDNSIAPAGTGMIETCRPTKKRSMKRGESATSPRRIKALTDRQLPALAYRRMGYTYSQIAQLLGYGSAQGAHKAVFSALTRFARNRSREASLLELERVDALFAKPYQDALNGDLAALSACLALMAYRAKLLGLDY